MKPLDPSHQTTPSDLARTFITCTVKGNTSGTILKTFPMRWGGNIWAALRRHKIPIGSSCSGVGVCAACAVRLEPASATETASEFEQKSLQTHEKPLTMRLACLCRAYGDVTVSHDAW